MSEDLESIRYGPIALSNENNDHRGPVLTVEYKVADRRPGAEDDRLIGGLWANLSEGRCRFVMVKEKRWDWIAEKL